MFGKIPASVRRREVGRAVGIAISHLKNAGVEFGQVEDAICCTTGVKFDPAVEVVFAHGSVIVNLYDESCAIRDGGA